MKFTFFTLIFLAGFISANYGQRIKDASVPTSVRSTFQQKFSGATKVTWTKEKNSDVEANFMMSGHETSATFSPQGLLKETEVEMKPSELPVSVLNYIKAHHKGSRIQEAAKITKPDGTILFEAQVNKKDLMFDSKGNFIKQ